MPYTSFIDISDVCVRFGYDVEKKAFLKSKKIIINDYFRDVLLIDYGDSGNFNNEYSICESIIRPIISVVARENNLPLWSHQQFNVDASLDLVGTPDYLLATKLPGGSRFDTPIVCLGEAKKDDFISGWAQVSAEMVAAQIKNDNRELPVYGLVSTGTLWQFGILVDNLFTIDPNFHVAPSELQKVFDILNWFFSDARKTLDELERLKSLKKNK